MEKEQGKSKGKVILSIAAAIYLVLFIFLNLVSTEVNFVFFSLKIPIAFLIIISTVLGPVVLWGIVSIVKMIRKMKGPKDSDEIIKEVEP